LRCGRLVNCCGHAGQARNRFSSVDYLNLALDGSPEFVYNLGKGSDFVEAVLALFDRIKIKIKLDLSLTVADT
jgi:hypothetical protein